jgi:HSP20 family molecular chaperone IbpA
MCGCLSDLCSHHPMLRSLRADNWGLRGLGLHDMPYLHDMFHEWADNMMVTESSDHITVRLAVPSITKGDDIEMHVSDMGGGNYNLSIEWKAEQATRGCTEQVRWVGEDWRQCCKSIPIPANCDKDAISAEHTDGQLVITMPKKRCTGDTCKGIKIKCRS